MAKRARLRAPLATRCSKAKRASPRQPTIARRSVMRPRSRSARWDRDRDRARVRVRVRVSHWVASCSHLQHEIARAVQLGHVIPPRPMHPHQRLGAVPRPRAPPHHLRPLSGAQQRVRVVTPR
eukprot:scaffold130171_cov78-Phaeocystis_antarctica.AAC.2